MNATHQDRVNNLIEELWDSVEKHESEGPGAVLRALAERVIGAEDRELERVVGHLGLSQSTCDELKACR